MRRHALTDSSSLGSRECFTSSVTFIFIACLYRANKGKGQRLLFPFLPPFYSASTRSNKRVQIRAQNTVLFRNIERDQFSIAYPLPDCLWMDAQFFRNIFDG